LVLGRKKRGEYPQIDESGRTIHRQSGQSASVVSVVGFAVRVLSNSRWLRRPLFHLPFEGTSSRHVTYENTTQSFGMVLVLIR
jgi:hypothetical protein